jgi:hypothetical protein
MLDPDAGFSGIIKCCRTSPAVCCSDQKTFSVNQEFSVNKMLVFVCRVSYRTTGMMTTPVPGVEVAAFVVAKEILACVLTVPERCVETPMGFFSFNFCIPLNCTGTYRGFRFAIEISGNVSFARGSSVQNCLLKRLSQRHV